MNEIKKFKEENSFYLPNFSLFFKEHLDIFSVFNSKERVNLFMKKLATNAKKFYDENKENDIPCPIQINNFNSYVLGVDYGFFLKNLIDFLIEEGGIKEEDEKQKAINLVYLFYGINFKNYGLNFPAQVLMKNLFGTIYGITSYKFFNLKGNVFYPYFIENMVGEIYKLNLFFIKKIAIIKTFSDKKNGNKIVNFFEENSESFIKKVPTNVKAKELFKVEKNYKRGLRLANKVFL